MHAAKHDVLARLSPSVRAALQSSAVRARVTVDDVVRAGLGRPGAPRAAAEVAARLAQQLPEAFEGLGTAWPEQCPFCLDLLTTPTTCAFCAGVGCSECVRGEGCPPCREAARQAHAARLAERRQRDRAAAA